MPVPQYLIDACEGIDAAMFSGDVLYQDESREKLKVYVGRWQRAIDGHVPVPEGEDDC
jgi:hypothetical protein